LKLLTNKSFLLPLTFLGAVALVCTQIPLLNYLGFEFALLMSVIAGFCCGLYCISLWKKEPPSSSSEYWNFVRKTLFDSFLLASLPFVLLSVNALFVKNCSYLQGVRLYALYVLPAVILSVALGLIACIVARKRRISVFVVVFLSILVHVVVVTLARPQIFAFNPIVGYFPGFTYDETIEGELRLFVYRVGTFAVSVLLLAAGDLLYRRKLRKEMHLPEDGRKVPAVAIIILCGAVCTGLYSVSDTVGFSSSEKFITDQLGGIIRTRHFRIVYPNKLLNDDQVRRLAILHEYLFDRLRTDLEVNPREPITTMIYASAAQKQRFIGAARTNFTKPWLRQVHLNLEDVEGMLKHELVHVMLAEQGLPFLQIAPNSGLIEGSAVAAERIEYDEMLHDLSGQIVALGIRSNIEEMFSFSGFFRSYPGVSYALAGSFCRYLIDRYGISKFKAVYKTGKFETWYRKDLKTLVSDWKSVIEETHPTREQLLKAAYLFKRPPIFARECARVIANANAATRGLMEQGAYDKALASAERSLSLTKSTEAISQKVNVLFRLKRYNEAIMFAEQQLSDSAALQSLLTIRLVLGDSYYAIGNNEKATRQYGEVLKVNLNNSWNEASAIRLQLVSSAELSNLLRPYVLGGLSDSARLALLENFKGSPNSGRLVQYLLGREYYAKGDYDRTVQILRSLAPMESSTLEYNRNRRLARSLFNKEEYESAKVFYWQALNDAPNEAHAVELEELLQKCEWIAQRMR
jgi:tetratricopeptide (TPR) repeat protein